MSQVTTYPLKHPITIKVQAAGGEPREVTTTEVTLRRPKGRHLRAMDNAPGKMSQALALIGAVTGLNRMEVDELDTEDVAELAEMIADFFPDLQKIGGGSSAT